MTKLEAVNLILEACGIAPVSALDTGGTSDAGRAETHLDRETTRILKDGWIANTIRSKTYDPDGSNNVVLTDVLRMQPAGSSIGRQLTIRDGKLYDLEDDTDEFTASVELQVALLLSFDVLPETLADHIAYQAALKYERRRKLGTKDDAVLREEAADAAVKAKQEDSDLRHTNLLEASAVIDLKGDRRKPY